MRSRLFAVVLLLSALCVLSPFAGARITLHHHRHASHRVSATKATADSSPQVWVNLPSGIYHYQGERWYGRTKNGEFMSEKEAISRGYRATENGQ